MAADIRLELEQQIHALLCGDLSPAETRSLLSVVLQDDGARALLAEMLTVQQQARAALGYEGIEKIVEGPMARLMGTLGDTDGKAKGSPLEVPRVQQRRSSGKLSWFLRVAALLVIAASVYVGITEHRSNRVLQERLKQLPRALAIPQLTAGDLTRYRLLWSHVEGRGGAESPWILLSDGGGEFGYLSKTAEPPADGRPVLLRCFFVAVDGRVVERVNVLLPTQRGIRLHLRDVGRVDGLPVGCEIAEEAGRVWVGLTVGGSPDAAVGIRGRTAVGNAPVEIGQIHVNGNRLRVFLHAVALEGVVG